jgi:hypothetical protein
MNEGLESAAAERCPAVGAARANAKQKPLKTFFKKSLTALNTING